jgi:hypothetical protein
LDGVLLAPAPVKVYGIEPMCRSFSAGPGEDLPAGGLGLPVISASSL